MKIHKTDKERIYFIMDSGACGSIRKEDISKLEYARNYNIEGKIDPRTDKCLVEKTMENTLRILERLNA